MAQPTLQTDRLFLRPFQATDAEELTKLAEDFEVAKFVPKIPYPYDVSDAQSWISCLEDKRQKEELVVFAVMLKSPSSDVSCDTRDTGVVTHDVIGHSGPLIGSVRLELQRAHDTAELGYWIGTRFAGKGFCTEAAKRLLQYGFHELNLNCIFAGHFSINSASGRVLQKLEMKYEGCLRARFKKFDTYMDDEMYSLLKSEFVLQ